jgi:hypothetical protein
MKQSDQLNHVLGNYIATGVNNPKKYPKEPLMGEKKREATKYTSDEAYERIARIKYKRK